MKKLLLVVGLFAATAAAPRARAAEGVMPTAMHGSSTTLVSLSSSTPTELTGSWGAWNICLQNIDTTSAISASTDIGVSSMTSSGKMGTVIPAAATASTPATPTCFLIYQGALFYAQTWSTTAATKVIVYMTR